MLIFNRTTISKALSIGVMLMGFVHIVATYTPLIVGKLALLPDDRENMDLLLYVKEDGKYWPTIGFTCI